MTVVVEAKWSPYVCIMSRPTLALALRPVEFNMEIIFLRAMTLNIKWEKIPNWGRLNGVSILIIFIFKYEVFVLLPYLGPKMQWHHITAIAQVWNTPFGTGEVHRMYAGFSYGPAVVLTHAWHLSPGWTWAKVWTRIFIIQ